MRRRNRILLTKPGLGVFKGIKDGLVFAPWKWQVRPPPLPPPGSSNATENRHLVGSLLAGPNFHLHVVVPVEVSKRLRWSRSVSSYVSSIFPPCAACWRGAAFSLEGKTTKQRRSARGRPRMSGSCSNRPRCRFDPMMFSRTSPGPTENLMKAAERAFAVPILRTIKAKARKKSDFFLQNDLQCPFLPLQSSMWVILCVVLQGSAAQYDGLSSSCGISGTLSQSSECAVQILLPPDAMLSWLASVVRD